VSGHDAVLIERRNGKPFLLGTDEPRKLKAALEAAARRPPAPLTRSWQALTRRPSCCASIHSCGPSSSGSPRRPALGQCAD